MLLQCALISHQWNQASTDEVLWRNLALQLGYCQLQRAAEERSTRTRVVASVMQRYEPPAEQASDQDLLQETIQRYRSRNTTTFFDTCNSWRQLCCHLWRLNCNWLPSLPTRKPEPVPVLSPTASSSSNVFRAADGSTPAPPFTFLFPSREIVHSKPEGSGVWRCKLDPDEGTVIVTCENGGVQVLDHVTKKLLWHIPRTATRSSPHLEFSRGWFIFDRPGIGHFEVWRSERLVPDLGRSPDRGHYQRFTILSSSRPILAYRFQFPYLCAASLDGYVTIWDVPEQKVVETIQLSNSPHAQGNITYIDFDNDFVFLTGAGAKCISVFSRHTQQMVWNMGHHFASGAAPPTTWRFDEFLTYGESHFSSPALVREWLVPASPGLWQTGPNTMNMAQQMMTPYQIWAAVHPDFKTKTLLVLGQGTVLLIRDYTKFFNNPTQAPDLFVEIEFDAVWVYGESGARQVTRNDLEERGTALLTVHEGRAVIVNEKIVILDMNIASAELHDGSGKTGHPIVTPLVERPAAAAAGSSSPKALLSTPPSRSGAAESAQRKEAAQGDAGGKSDVPPVLVYTDLDRPLSNSEADVYMDCSCVQMDEVGVYITADQETMPLWLQEKRAMQGEDIFEDRSLLRLDFSRREPLRSGR